MNRCAVPLIVVLVLCLIAPALSRAAADDQESHKPQRHDVAIRGMKFDPDKLDVAPGDTVVWTNKDDRDHTVVAKDGSFKSDNLGHDETFKYQFKKPGTYAYGCSLHPRMRGTIIVKGD